MKGVIIISGGMDSVTLLHHLVKNKKYEMMALSFDYGQKHSKELDCAKRNCEKLQIPHRVVKLPLADLFKSNLLAGQGIIPEGHYEDENMKQTVVPNRNMIMASVAAGYGMSHGAEFLALGVHAGDHAIYPDCREEFIEAFRKAIELADWNPFTIKAPFLGLDKKEILKVGLNCGVDYKDTWTCYKGEFWACGKCGSCTERLEAFELLGKTDPVEYE